VLSYDARGVPNDAGSVFDGRAGVQHVHYERMAELVKSLTHLEPPEYFTQIALERFSPYFERPNESGLKIVGPRTYYRLVFPCEESTLNDLAYNFDYVHADGRKPNSYVTGLSERIESWQKQLRARPLLEYRRGPGFLVIRDRRPGRTRSDYSLAENETKVYLACDGGATPMAVWKSLQTGDETAIGLEDVEDFLDEMTAARLMYREDNVYLSLAVPMNPRMTSANANARITSAKAAVSNSLVTSQVLTQ